MVPPPENPKPQSPDKLPPKPRPPSHRSELVSWATLMRHSSSIDVESCQKSACGGRMRLVSVITDPAAIHRILRHLGEPTEPESLEPARGPPYFRSRLFRRHAARLATDVPSAA